MTELIDLVTDNQNEVIFFDQKGFSTLDQELFRWNCKGVWTNDRLSSSRIPNLTLMLACSNKRLVAFQ